MVEARPHRVTVTPEMLDFLQFRNQHNALAIADWIRATPAAVLPTVQEIIGYHDHAATAMSELEESLGLKDAYAVQSSLELILTAAETDKPAPPLPVRRLPPGVHGPEYPRLAVLPLVPDNIKDAIEAGTEAAVTGANFLPMIKSASYPWWWGPITSLADVSYMLNAELQAFQRAYLPQATKDIATENISAAMTYVRDQRARGGEKIPF